MRVEPHLIRTKTRVSPRVRAVAVAIARIAARERIGITVDEAQALQLAGTGDLREALDRLAERLEVTREVPGMPADGGFQQTLAVLEVATTIDAAPDVRGDIIRTVMANVASHVGRIVELEHSSEALESYMRDVGERSGVLRHFVRDAGRLRAAQLRRLRRYVADPGAMAKHVAELNAIYLRYLRSAAGL